MRILHIIPELNKGGAERLVLNICNELYLQKDVKVLLITFRGSNAFPFLTEKINWKVIPTSVSLSFMNKTNAKVLKLQKSIEEFNPDIIHSHLFETEIVLSQINFPSAKYFVHFHNNMIQFRNLTLNLYFSKRSLTNYFEKRILLQSYKKRRTHFIAISEDTLNFINRVLPRYAYKLLNLNAIDLFRFKPTLESIKEYRIITIGSLVKNKGHILAIETIEILVKRGHIIHLDILGDGELRQELNCFIKRKSLSNCVKIHGNVDHPEYFLNQSKIYIHTSFKEAFGLAIIEAMACGLPVVCTDGQGNRDLIKEGFNGYMVWERDPNLLADKIELLINDEEKRKVMGINARKFSEGFGIEQYVEKLLTLYQS